MKKFSSFIAALFLYFLLFYFVMNSTLETKLDLSSYLDYRTVILKGWLTTISISFISLIFALFIGLLLYFMQQSRFHVIRYISEIHRIIIFGTPLVVLAIVAYYYIGNAFGMTSKFWVGVWTLALYIGAYISDIYKGAIESIHSQQWQTAKMFGFSKYQTYRYIIFPQVLRSILPPLAGQFAMTIKSSALLSYMATDEFLNTINTVRSISFQNTVGFIIVTLGYLLITVPLLFGVKLLEKMAKFE